MLAWLFPGQGAQHRGMGSDLFERYPEEVAAADSCLGYSVAELCRDDPHDQLTGTRYAQPALFVVGALSALSAAEHGPRPDFLAGHSLGEYAALFAAGCFDLTTGTRLVDRRGELMAEAGEGGMLAVLGPGAKDVEALLAEIGQHDVDLANDNAHDQVILSGPVASLRTVGREVRARGERSVPLAVTSAFHSRYMAKAAASFAEVLAGVEFAEPRHPVLSNVTSEPYAPGSIRRLLAEQIRSPVRWQQSMRYLVDRGVSRVEELGPGTVLTRLWGAAQRPGTSRRARRAGAPGQVRQACGPQTLGSPAFRRDYGLKYAYLSGSMYHGIASAELVIRMGKAGLMGFFGAGGLGLPDLEAALVEITAALGRGGRFGMNLLHSPGRPDLEHSVVDLYLRHGVRYVEAAAYSAITAPLVRFRLTGAHRDAAGKPVAAHHVLAKVSRPEVASAFLRPPPEVLVRRLVADGLLSGTEAEVAAVLPVSDDVCVEADSGGHTDGGVALALLPTILRLRDRLAVEYGYPGRIRVGAAGGLGAPEALAAVFVLGADFVVTGSINQCSPEAGTSEAVKDMLAGLDVQDTTYAPAGDMFEAGARVQVVRKGTLFAARANRLYQVYRRYGGLQEIDPATTRSLEHDLIGRPFADIWAAVRDHLAEHRPEDLARAERDPKRRMALVLRWYFRWSTEVAMRGDPDERANYQIHCGPAIGAFNRWVEGTDLQDWRHRHVDVVAERLMTATAQLLGARLHALTAPAGNGAGGSS